MGLRGANVQRWKERMPEQTTAERLTSWAAGSDNRAVQFVRTTLGPLLLILFTPPAAIIFWIVCTFQPFNGSLTPLLSAGRLGLGGSPLAVAEHGGGGDHTGLRGG